MKKNLFICLLFVTSLILSHKYICLREKCDSLKNKTKSLEIVRSQFENLNIRNKQLQEDFSTCCLPHKQTIALMESLIDKNTWDEFAHDWCLAPKEIAARFCNTKNYFYQGHLSFFVFPEEIPACMQQLLQLPSWPFAISIKRKFSFNPILEVRIEYFFASGNKSDKTNS